MKNKILTIEQMQELSTLGIDTSKASMYWAWAELPKAIPFKEKAIKDLFNFWLHEDGAVCGIVKEE